MNDPKSILEPLAGYVLDMGAKLMQRPFVPHSLVKLQNIRVCRDLSDARMAIEIGSFKGVTTRRLSYLFDEVISVEIDENLFEEAKRRCTGRNNVELIRGDGAIVLPDLGPRLDRALLFLDGHFSGGETGQGDEPEPVLKELDLLAGHLDRLAAVVIDDFRLFGVEPGWPSKNAVLRKVEDTFPRPEWAITVQYDQVLAYRKSAGRPH
jgi:hypothetical protein